VGEALVAHLLSLPSPQLARIAHTVLGAPRGTADHTAHAIAERLLDPEWVRRTLAALGADARAALATIARAGTPVLRRDIAALASSHGIDPVDALEERGIVRPVRLGRGMPTHVALAPELSNRVLALLPEDSDGTAAGGRALTGARRRFELALMLAAVGQHPPRLTRTGRLHASDLQRLESHLAPLGLHADAIEKRLTRWVDVGAAVLEGGVAATTSAAFDNVPHLALLLALTQLAAPATPEETTRIVGRLLATGGTLPLRTAIALAQTSLLQKRAEDSEGSQRGARAELVDIVRSLLSLDAIVLQDADGTPIPIDDSTSLQFKESQPTLALDPLVAAALRGEPAPPDRYSRGHVQSSFEIVADSACDPTLIAGIAVWSRLVRADRAAVLRLEKETIARARTLGFRLDQLLSSLAALGDGPVPANVSTMIRGWFASAPDPADTMRHGTRLRVELADALREARTAVLPGS
jgi:hypothetical protein